MDEGVNENVEALSGKFGEEKPEDAERKKELEKLIRYPCQIKSRAPDRFNVEDIMAYWPGGKLSDRVNFESWCEDEQGNKIYGIYRGRSLKDMTHEELISLVLEQAEARSTDFYRAQEAAEMNAIRCENGD